MQRFLAIIFLIFFSVVLHAQNNLNIEKIAQLSYDGVPLNDVWGYSNNGREFALVGTYDGLSIVELTQAQSPVELHYVQTVNSVWKDIKTYSHYAYVTHGIYSSSGNQSTGLLIVDLNTVDQEQMTVYNYKIDGVFETAHNLFIDEQGFAYLFGVNEIGGALILDLRQDPTSPVFVSYYKGHYLHDGYVRDNTLYGCADKNGYFVIVDVSDKYNPKELVTSDTPNRTTHSAWLSDDGNFLFTTDERMSAYISSFDVSDKDNISQLDAIRSRYTDKSIPHNTMIIDNYLISSYYAQGIQIVDATKPDNLVEVASYDSTPSEKVEFNGAWGVYPFLPSGLILLSDTETGLHILSPNYQRAAYFEGFVKDISNNGAIFNAEIEIVNQATVEYSSAMGQFKTGVHQSGELQVLIRKEGYKEKSISVDFVQGQTAQMDIYLEKSTLGIDDQLLSEIKVFPNPFKNFLQVDYRFEDTIDSRAHLILSNVLGQQVYRIDLRKNQDSVIIDKELQSGLYFVQLFNGSKQSKAIRVVKD